MPEIGTARARLAQAARIPVGLENPVATTAVLDGRRELRPGGEVIELPGMGYHPQVEVPHEFARGPLLLMDLLR